jgi:hypothetical protein
MSSSGDYGDKFYGSQFMVPLPPDDDGPRPGKGDRWRPTGSDWLTILALVVAVAVSFAPPNWKIGAPIVLITIIVILVAAIRDQSHPARRTAIALALSAYLLWAVWEPIWKSFSTDFPGITLQWLFSSTEQNYPPEFLRDGCGGILHRADGDLRFGGEIGEGESICVINKTEEAKVLAACSIGHRCRIKGTITPCVGSGEARLTWNSYAHRYTYPAEGELLCPGFCVRQQ